MLCSRGDLILLFCWAVRPSCAPARSLELRSCPITGLTRLKAATQPYTSNEAPATSLTPLTRLRPPITAALSPPALIKSYVELRSGSWKVPSPRLRSSPALRQPLPHPAPLQKGFFCILRPLRTFILYPAPLKDIYYLFGAP